MSVGLIYNSRSGNYNTQLLAIIKKKLNYLNQQLFIIDAANEAILLKSDCDFVCVAAGDGTINAVVNYIFNNHQENKIKILIVPLGSANVLAHFLGIRRRIILKNWNKLTNKKIEVGKLDDCFFLSAASLGQISQIISRAKQGHKKILGFIAYFFHLLTCSQLDEHLFTIQIDGEEKKVCAHSIIFSVGISVVGWHPRLNRPDGLIDVYLLKNHNRWEYLKVFWAFIKNKNNDSLEKFSGNQIDCWSDELLDKQIDGEAKLQDNRMTSQIAGQITILL
jgi:diacylglycerol kinase family enzyme